MNNGLTFQTSVFEYLAQYWKALIVVWTSCFYSVLKLITNIYKDEQSFLT